MVRNQTGGNKSKGVARKHINGAKEARALRLSGCSLEKYGVVIRVLGNGMFYVVTDVATDEKPHLLGHIRNKFRGRSKRDNTISLGSFVLIGLRDWEEPNYKECDLLEVYDSNEIRQLMKNPSIDFSELRRHMDAHGSVDASTSAGDYGGGDIEFTEERDYMDGMIPIDSEIPSGNSTYNQKSEELVDIDDI